MPAAKLTMSAALGIGDEPLSLKAGMTAADRDKVSLTREQKAAALKAMLSSVK